MNTETNTAAAAPVALPLGHITKVSDRRDLLAMLRALQGAGLKITREQNDDTVEVVYPGKNPQVVLDAVRTNTSTWLVRHHRNLFV